MSYWKIILLEEIVNCTVSHCDFGGRVDKLGRREELPSMNQFGISFSLIPLVPQARLYYKIGSMKETVLVDNG